MKIFPPLSEMLWPPGLSTAGLLWRRRYILVVMIAATAGTVAWPLIETDNERQAARGLRALAAATELDGSACSSLTRQSGDLDTRAKACKPFRIHIGPSVAAKQPLKRSALPLDKGTLTAADRAIVRPQNLRSTVFDDRQVGPLAPAIALSPK